uniref:Ribonuclease H-like domain-containing protein n=1 Tax=Tanacetum cinerariifolium TaxID=118510 RepID=A0A6L2M9G5_TANCI|nr:ribonuclease H-like domain-containing protein [Tanacetum cinerariifolium]
MDMGASSHLPDNTGYKTHKVLLHCESTGDLYSVTQQPPFTSPFAFYSFSSTTWHRRLGHPRDDVLRQLE